MTPRTLRDYQLEALDLTRRHFDTKDSGVVVWATGVGKTVYAARLASEWPHGPVLFLAHRKELIYQARDKVAAEIGYVPAVEMADEGRDDDHEMWTGSPIVVGSVQTMRNPKRLEKYRNNPFSLICVDEAHHSAAPSYRTIIDYYRNLNPKVKIVGITATPKRTDKKALGLVFDAADGDYGDAIHRMDILDSIRAGWLCDIHQEYIQCDELNLDGIDITYNEVGERDYDTGQLEALLTEEGSLYRIIKALTEKCQGPTLVFTPGVKSAHLLASILNGKTPGCAAAVDGTTPRMERESIVKAMNKGELKYLTNFGVFTEGFDCPAILNIVMLRISQSMMLVMQMLGRGLRPRDEISHTLGTIPDAEGRRLLIKNDPFKSKCNVFDFAGNSKFPAITAADCLSGTFSTEAVRRAKQKLLGGGSVTEALDGAEEDIENEKKAKLAAEEKARAKLLADQEERRRQAIRRYLPVASTDYRSVVVDPFRGADVATQAPVKTRGGATDPQINFLVSLGVDYNTAAAYSKGQAGVVITKLKAKRCTVKMQATLKRHGFDPNTPFDAAHEIIDRIAASGWTLKAERATA